MTKNYSTFIQEKYNIWLKNYPELQSIVEDYILQRENQIWQEVNTFKFIFYLVFWAFISLGVTGIIAILIWGAISLPSQASYEAELFKHRQEVNKKLEECSTKLEYLETLTKKKLDERTIH